MITEYEDVWTILETVQDPEIPVVSLVDLGIVREVEFEAESGSVTVTITPTFSGCPALHVMEEDVRTALLAAGAASVEVRRQLAPAWTTDWISDDGRQKLKAFGLAPPAVHHGNLVATFFDIVACPRCDSRNTTIQNTFGSTLCRAIWVCNECREPFEQFKPI